MAEIIIPYASLLSFTENIFIKTGCSQEDAKLGAKVLLSADLRGVDSHGVARLSGYIRLWEAGRINAAPKVKVVYETPSTAVVDGDRGLGLVVAPKAMKVAIEKAKEKKAGKIILYSNTKLVPAIELYRKLGFKEIPVDGPYQRSDIKMELVLS